MRAATGCNYDDDQLLNVIDIIWDWYEDHGMLDISLDDDDDDDVNIDELKNHVTKMLRKDRGSVISPDDVSALVDAELSYENTIEL